MTHGGRPRREDEQPDSPFGKALKEYLRRVEDFTQTELARATGIPEKTLSQMVKGKRTSGTMLRRDLRDIIRVLHQKKALYSLNEANRLITTIPAVSDLDERDPEDAKIIALFNTPGTDGEQAAGPNKDEAASPNVHASSESRDNAFASDAMPAPPITLPPIIPSPVSETTGRSERKTKKRLWWYVGSILMALAIMLAAVTGLIFSRKTNACADNTNGVGRTPLTGGQES